MQSSRGGRFDARLQDHDERGARFRVELDTPEGRWSARAEVNAGDGEVQMLDWSGPGAPPEWLVSYLQAALRAAFRGLPGSGWPRRITRWREARADRGEREESHE